MMRLNKRRRLISKEDGIKRRSKNNQNSSCLFEFGLKFLCQINNNYSKSIIARKTQNIRKKKRRRLIILEEIKCFCYFILRVGIVVVVVVAFFLY